MSKRASIFRLVSMALMFVCIVVLLIPGLLNSKSEFERTFAPVLAVGFGAMCADLLWIYTKLNKLAGVVAKYFMGSTRALSIEGLLIKLAIWLAIILLPFGAIGAVFFGFSNFVGGFKELTVGNAILCFAVLVVIPLVLAVPMVFSDICHIKGVRLIDWIKALFRKKKQGGTDETGVIEVQAVEVESAEPETTGEDEGQGSQTTKNTEQSEL